MNCHLWLRVLIFMAAAALLPSRAAAQLFSPTASLNSVLSHTGDPLGLNPSQFESILELPVDTAPHLSVGLSRADTVRTVRNGFHTGDLYGSGRFLDLRVGDIAGVSAQLWLSSTVEHGDSGNPGKEYVQGAGTDTDWAFRIQAVHGGAGYYAGYRRDDAHGTFDSENFASLLPVLPGSVQLAVDGYSTLANIGGFCTPVHGFRLEASAGSETCPTGLTLSNGSHTLTLPVDVAGFVWSLASTVQISRRIGAFGYWQHVDLAGAGQVQLNGLGIGGSSNSSMDREWGLGVRTKLDGRSELLLSYTSAQLALDAQSTGVAPGPLGLAGATGAGYYVTGDMNRHEIRLSWRRTYEKRRCLEADLRWLDTPFDLAYGYYASYFIFSSGSSGGYTVSPARAGEIRLRYTMPAHRVNLTFDLSQLVPVDLHAGQASAATGLGPAGPRSTSYGGWSASVELGVPF